MSGTRARLPLLLLGLAALSAAGVWLCTEWGRQEAHRSSGDAGAEAAPGAAAPDAWDGAPARPAAAPLAPGGRPLGGAGRSASAPVAAPAELVDGPFRGVCVDARWTPVPGAMIHVVAGLAKEGGGIDPSRFADVVAASDGVFEIPGPSDVASVRVRATAEGLAPIRSDEEITRAGAPWIRLMKAAEIRVRVVAAAGGAAVPGARVFAYVVRDAGSRRDAPPVGDLVAGAEATTDVGGRARLPTSGGRCAVLVLPRDHAPRWEWHSVPSAGIDIDVRVYAGDTWLGRVVDEAGAGVAGARVRAAGPLLWSAALATDADGRFRLEHLPIENFTGGIIEVAAYVPGKPRALELVLFPTYDHGPVSFDLVVRPWQRLEGTVVNPMNLPVSGALVRLGESPPRTRLPWSLDGDPVPETRTDASGKFTLGQWSESEGLTIRKDGSGGGRWRRRGNPEEVSKLEVFPLEPVDALEEDILAGPAFDVLLEAPARGGGGTVLSRTDGVLAGRVLRLDGTPARMGLRFERVIRSVGGIAARLGNATATTDEEGRFRCVGLGEGEYEVMPADETFTLCAGPAYALAGDDDLRYVAATATEVEALHLAFELLDAETGRPIPSPSASVYLTGYFPPSDPTGLGLPLLRVPGEQVWRTRDALPPGTWEVVLGASDYAPVTIPDVRVPDAERGSRRSLRLVARGRIEGVVVTRDGRPLPSGVVVAARGRKMEVGSDGTFSLVITPPNRGPIDLETSGDYIRPSSTAVTVENGRRTGLRIEVVAAGAIRIVLAEGRRPTRDARLSLQPVGPSAGASEVGLFVDRDWVGDGAPVAVLPGLVPGVYRVTGTWDDSALPAREVVVRAGETSPLEVRQP